MNIGGTQRIRTNDEENEENETQQFSKKEKTETQLVEKKQSGQCTQIEELSDSAMSE